MLVFLVCPACRHAGQTAEPASSVGRGRGQPLTLDFSQPSLKTPTLSQQGPAPKPSFSLKFVHEQVLEPGLSFKNIPVGGLSALAWDSQNKMFLALSDDKGNKGFPPRFYQFRLSQKKDRYHLDLINHVILRDKKGQHFVPIDPEGMAILYDSDRSSPGPAGQQNPFSARILISSEGAQLPTLKAPPQVFVFNTKGQWQSSFPVWDMYWRPRQTGKWGVKENKAFEALSLDPEQANMYWATESSLHQDDSSERTAVQNRQFIRITRQSIKNKALRLKGVNKHQQYAYPMDLFMEKGNMQGTNGLTDFVALGNKKLITLERAYLKKKGLSGDRKMDANLARLFLTDCSQASNVFLKKSLNKGDFVACQKTMMADLSSLSSLSSLSKVKVDNMEGLALGPEISKGTYLLVLVSDNNFSSRQKTQFLFFHYSLKDRE